MVIEMKRDPAFLESTLILPLILLAFLPAASLFLPPDDSSKLDIQISAMLAYSVYIMILSDTIPPFSYENMPTIGKLLPFDRSNTYLKFSSVFSIDITIENLTIVMSVK